MHKVALTMGSKSDWSVMSHCAEMLERLDVHHDALIVSAHRTPDRLVSFAKSAEQNGYSVIIAAAGGAAHLPGMIASMTQIPVFGVPIPATTLDGMDSLLSIVQMPAGIPVGTLAIGKPGAINAALLAASVIALDNPETRDLLRAFRREQTDKVGQFPSESAATAESP